MNRCKHISRAALLALVLVAGGCTSERGATAPGTPGAENATEASAEPRAAKRRTGGLTVSINGYSPDKGDIEFVFSHAMVDADKLATAKPVAVVMTPQPEGSWAWKSNRKLAFRPVDPSALGSWKIEVRIDEADALNGASLAKPYKRTFWAPPVSAGAKYSSHAVERGKPRFLGMFYKGRLRVGKLPVLVLFDQPVEPEDMAAKGLALIDGSGNKIPSRVFRPQNTKPFYDQPIDLRMVVAMEPASLRKRDLTVKLRAPDHDKAGKASFKERVVETVHELQLKPNDRKRVGIGGYWYINANAPLDPASAKKHIQVTPHSKGFTISSSGEGAWVEGGFQAGTLYTVTMKKGLADRYGNTLGKDVQWTVRADDHRPTIATPRPGLVVEPGNARVPVEVLNLGEPEVRTYRFRRVEDFVAAVNSGWKSDCSDYNAKMDLVGVTKASAAGTLNQRAVIDVALPLKGKPGLVCVEVTGSGIGNQVNTRRAPSWATVVQVTNIGAMAKMSADELLVWTTELSSGVPRKAKVSVLDRKDNTLAGGSTDRRGVAKLKMTAGKPRFLVISRGGDRAVVSLRASHLAQPWQFGLRGASRNAVKPLTAALFTERGVYRPGETVYGKAVVRDDATFGAPTNRRARVAIVNSRGKTVLNKTVALDATGGAAVELPLPAGKAAPTGTYTMRVSQGKARASHTFMVQEYRVPTFAVDVSDEGRAWVPGTKQSVVIAAQYLSGGALGGREVNYRVTRVEEPYRSKTWSAFTFGNHDARAKTTTVAAGKKRLDGRGRLTVDVAIADAPVSGNVRFEVKASVADVDNQSYAGSLRRSVPSNISRVGLKMPRRSVVQAKSKLLVPVVVLDAAGRPQAGLRVKVSVQNLETHAANRSNGSGVDAIQHDVLTSAGSCVVVSADAPRACEIAFPAAGRYRLVATLEDDSQRIGAASANLVASGARPAAWPRFEHERIEVTKDKATYQVGETAQLVVANPFTDTEVHALITLERDGVIDHRVMKLPKGTPSLPVPLTMAHAPNVYASVVLVKGRTSKARDGVGRDVGSPAFRMGYATLKVFPKGTDATVQVTPRQKRIEPGQTLTLDLAMKDSRGNPLNGVATVAVVDEAVLGLTGFRTPQLKASLFKTRPLSVKTAESRLDTMSARRDRHAVVFAGGDGDEDTGGVVSTRSDTPAKCLKVKGPNGVVRCPTDPAARTRKKAEAEQLKVRSNFASTALFKGDVAVRGGVATLEVPLPDNDTTWRVMVVAADEKGAFGSASAQVVAKKPLLVQAVTPRFVFPGDRLKFGILVKNGTDVAGDASVSAELKHATFAGRDDAPKASDHTATATTTLSASGQSLVEFDIAVPDTAAGAVEFKLVASLAGHADAVSVTVPILNPASPRTQVLSQKVLKSGELAMAISEHRVAGSDDYEVIVSTSGLSALKESVDYIMGYPHGCIEQTTSGAYPLLVLKDLLPEMGVDVDLAQLRKYATAGVNRLLSFQTTSGGLSYWPGEDKPHAFGTAFGLTALLEAKKQGYTVDDVALARMGDYLEKQMAQPSVSEQMPHGGMADGDTMALFAMTLGRMGRPQPVGIDRLWAQRSKLTPFGLSFLAVAAQEYAGRRHLADPILAAVRESARENDSEAWFEGDKAKGYSMGSPLRSHAGALLAWAGAKPERDTTKKLLTGLVSRARNGQWGNTQENVFGIMAVAKAVRSQPAGDAPTATLSVNGREIPMADLEPIGGKASGRRLRFSAGEFGVPTGTGPGDLGVRVTNGGATAVTLTVRSRHKVALTPATMKARTAGFTVKRHYTTVDGKPLSLKGGIPLGSVVRVNLEVRAHAGANYVALDDRLPGGLEPLNAKFKTTALPSGGKGAKPTKAVLAGLRVLSYQEIRDARVSFYADELPKGTYAFSYLARATTAGDFLRPAATAEAMYAPEVNGATSIDRVVVN